MKNLTITISNAEFEKLGINKENLTFSELVEIIKNEISKQQLNVVSEPAERYTTTKMPGKKNEIEENINMKTMENYLSNVQIELLKLFSNNVPDNQLNDIKLLMAKYFAEQATRAMDKVWDENQLSDDDMKKWSHEHNRHQGSY